MAEDRASLPARTLAEIKVRADGATPGPWMFDRSPGARVFNIHCSLEPYLAKVAGPTDAAFIAQARHDVPRLVAEVERAWRELARQQQEYEVLLDDERHRAYDLIVHQKAAEDELRERLDRCEQRLAELRQMALRARSGGHEIPPEDVLRLSGDDE